MWAARLPATIRVPGLSHFSGPVLALLRNQLDTETGRNVCKSRGLLGYAQVGVQTRDLGAMIADRGQGAMVQSAPTPGNEAGRTCGPLGVLPVRLLSRLMHPQLHS